MHGFLERIAPYWRPHAGQLEFLASRAKLKVLACGRQWGKTQACAAAVAGLLSEAKPARVLIVAPTMDQARVLFERVVELLEGVGRWALGDAYRAGDCRKPGTRGEPPLETTGGPPVPRNLPRGRGVPRPAQSPTSTGRAHEGRRLRGIEIKYSPYPKLTFGGHEVVARSGFKPSSLRGHNATHIIVDEAAFVHRNLVMETLWPMLATTDGELTLISTPNGFNAFQRLFSFAREGRFGGWAKTAPTSENPHVAPGFLDTQRELNSERTYAAEYEAEFISAEDAVFREQAILGCILWERPEDWGDARGQIFIGIDWGRVRDWTAVAVVCGTQERARLVELRRLQGSMYTTQAEIVSEVLARYPQASILCDSTGVGDATVDILRRAIPQRSIKEYRFTQESRRILLDRLVSLIERGALRFLHDEQLLRELRAFRWKGGRAEGDGEHDDLVMALALACIHLPQDSGSRVRLGPDRKY